MNISEMSFELRPNDPIDYIKPRHFKQTLTNSRYNFLYYSWNPDECKVKYGNDLECFQFPSTYFIWILWWNINK